MGRSLLAFVVHLALAGSPLFSQGGGPLFINEVIADNGSVPPLDIGGGTPDMVEIFNASNEQIVLGAASDLSSFFLSDTLKFDANSAWRFPVGRSTIPPRGFLVIFCDGNAQAQNIEGECELHATFELSQNGDEPVTLWGPEVGGQRPIVDQVWLPPLRRNVSLARFPDGAGPAPVPINETLDHFVYCQLGAAAEPTFGSCPVTGGGCPLGLRRTCLGAPNESGVNLEPRLNRVFESTNNPRAGEAVTFVTEVRDDKEPTSGNITQVQIIYSVNGGTDQIAGMTQDGGVLTGSRTCTMPPSMPDPFECGQPLDRWTLWRGSIPGQNAGARVQFYFRVQDAEGLSSTEPRDLCPAGVGPCDREFGGPNCALDTMDVTCEEPDPPAVGRRYIACDARLTYTVAYVPRAAVSRVVINEVVPRQTNLKIDPSEPMCVAMDMCPPENLNCCRSDEDFIELLNPSDQAVDLSGCWLSDSFFEPRRWQFPAGSVLPARARLCVWLDNDGGRCPNPMDTQIPCFWECPDPTNPAALVFHTNFAFNANGDQVFLYDTEANHFGVIHGLDFSDPSAFPGFSPLDELGMPNTAVLANQSLSLVPDGDRNGCWVIVERGTPLLENQPPPDFSCMTEVTFRRGDANDSAVVDLSDGVFVLNFLFSGSTTPSCQDAADADNNGVLELTDAIRILNFLFLGSAPPPAPGPFTCGTDPSEDPLPPCVTVRC
jgi:hypothetical protein